MIKVHGALTSLNLTYNSIGPEGGVAIAKALEVNGALTSLNLSVNSIGDEGATALAGALGQLKQLTEFRISCTCVLRWYALVIGFGMRVTLVRIVVSVGV